MSPLFRILLGLVVMGIGFLVVWKTEVLFGWLGRNDWAERVLGPGESRLLYKLIGIGVVFVGIFIATNIVADILGSFASIFIR